MNNKIMTQEDKKLLLVDLCARLPYKPKVYFSIVEDNKPVELSLELIRCLQSIPLGQNEIVIKPYLRPMSSMTKEEEKDFRKFQLDYSNITFDWLNAHHFDFRNLIERGLAIAVTEENNPYKEQRYDTRRAC